MDILSFLPSSSELGPDAFRPWKDGSESKRLVLTVPHSVSAKVGTQEVAGSADIHYVLEAPKVNPSVKGGLVTMRGVAYVGSQSPDVIRTLMEDLRPRTSYSVAAVAQGIFDLRGLCYVCGAAAAAGAANLTATYPNDIASMRLLSPNWTVPVAGELTIGPGIASSGREFVTLALLAKAADMPRLQLMADLLPNTSEAPLQGAELAGFAFKLFANIMAAAQGCACGTHHLQAFYRGMTSAWSLWSHTDEGGWVRKALTQAVYPPGSGILALTTEEFMSLPLKVRMDPSEVTKVAVGLFLVCTGAIPVADAFAAGISTVFERLPGSEARPSSFEGLADHTYTVFARWREMVGPLFGLHPSSISDRYSMDPYFRDDKIDPHLDYEAIVAFWYVEPGPLYPYDSGKLRMPCVRGRAVDLRLLECTGVVLPDIGQTRTGTYPRGVSVSLHVPKGNLRMSGVSYIFSGSYRPENGLSYMDVERDPEYGFYTTDAMFVDNEVTNLAARRWRTPHNPIMNTVEGYTKTGQSIRYTYVGRSFDPSIHDWEHCTVQSTLGFFLLNERVDPFSTATFHTVPPGYALLTRYLHSGPRDLVSRKKMVFGAGSDNTSGGQSLEPFDPLVVFSTPPAPPPDSAGVNVNLDIVTPQAPAPPVVSEPRRVPVTADIGVKQGSGSSNIQKDAVAGSL